MVLSILYIYIYTRNMLMKLPRLFQTRRDIRRRDCRNKKCLFYTVKSVMAMTVKQSDLK